MAIFSNVAGIAGSRGLGPKQRMSRGSLNYSIEPTLWPVLCVIVLILCSTPPHPSSSQPTPAKIRFTDTLG